MNEVTKIIEYALAYIQNNKGLDKIYKNIQKSDSVVYKHSYRVAQIAVALGLTYRFNLAELIDIAVGALLHDCGKVFLNKG